MNENDRILIKNIKEKDRYLFEELANEAKNRAELDTVSSSDLMFVYLADFSNPVQNLLKTLFNCYKAGETDHDKALQKVEDLLKELERKPEEESKLVEKKRQIQPASNEQQQQQIEEIDDIKCCCECYSKEVFNLISESEISQILKEFIIKKRLYSRNIIMNGSKQEKYHLVDEINIADELGQWRFHPLFDMMDIYIKRSGAQKFPQKWRLKPEFDFMKTKISPSYIEQKNSDDKNTFQKASDLSLEDFMKDIVEKHEKDGTQVKKWVEILRNEGVDTIEELLQWDQNDLRGLEKIPRQIKIILQNELNKFKFRQSAEEDKNSSAAKNISIAHRIKRYFYSLAGRSDELGYIDQKVVELAFEEVKAYYEGESLLKQIKTFYQGYTVPMRKKGNVILQRGMILFGPPGTGKTTLTDDLPLKIGLTPISHSLSASEVNRGIVGQTEKLLLDLCNRARKMPHLLCCVSIDEIDSLTPKRDEKSSQHKTDGIAVLLAVIGGIKDVPNLVFLASTNRLNQIDDAIKRRLSGQFFVGRPPPKARRNILKKINTEKIKTPDGRYVDQIIMQDKELEEAVKMTTNFSGAALKQLVSYLIVYYRCEKKEGDIDLNEIVNYAKLASQQFSIKLGTYSLPELFLNRIQKQAQGKSEKIVVECTKNQKRSQKLDAGIKLPELLALSLDESAKYSQDPLHYELAFTGRVILNLTDIQTAKIEYQLKDEFQLLIEEHKVISSTINDFLPRFADLVSERNIDYIQLFNLDFLLDNNAFDEGKIMENINEKLQELGAYDKSLLIIDMDSLCGISISQSESNMGPSTSYSFANTKLFSFAIHAAMTKNFIEKNKEIWIVLSCKHPYLLQCAMKALNWMKTPKQIQKEKEQEEENTKEKLCTQCKQLYLEVDNKLGTCNYHDGFLFESGAPREIWVPLEDDDEINNIKCDPKVNERALKWICCINNVESQGCIKGKHSVHPTDPNNYWSKFEKLKAG